MIELDCAGSHHLDAPMCDTCGEQAASVRMLHVGLCDDCSQIELRRALQGNMGTVCARILRYNGNMSVCLAPYGAEHDHC